MCSTEGDGVRYAGAARDSWTRYLEHRPDGEAAQGAALPSGKASGNRPIRLAVQELAFPVTVGAAARRLGHPGHCCEEAVVEAPDCSPQG